MSSLEAKNTIGVDIAGVQGTATLFGDRAPTIVSSLLAALPMVSVVRQGKWTGNLIYGPLDETTFDGLDQVENRITFVAPGQLCYFAWPKGLRYPLKEIVLSYGESLLCNGAAGGLWGSLVGTLTDGKDDLLAVAADLQMRGAVDMRLYAL